MGVTNYRIKTGESTQEVRKRIYIAGKVTGEEWDDVALKFQDAAILLKSKGHDVVNPVEYSCPEANWKVAMRACIMQMLECRCGLYAALLAQKPRRNIGTFYRRQRRN